MTDDWVDEVVQQMLVHYTSWVNGEPVPWNVRKAEAKDYIRAKQAEAVESARINAEHYWIKYYGDQRKYLDGSDGDQSQIKELNRHQKLHKDRLSQLTNNTEKE